MPAPRPSFPESSNALHPTVSEAEGTSLAGSLLRWAMAALFVGGMMFGAWRFLDPPQPRPTPVAAGGEAPPPPDSGLPDDLPLAAPPAPGFLPESPAVVAGEALPTPEPLPELPPIPEAVVRPDRITIPAIKLDAPVKAVGYRTYEQDNEKYVQWAVPNEAALGWAALSAGLGQVGNTVLDGHHNVYGEVFRWLVNISIGDAITLFSGDRAFSYVVTEKYILPEVGQPLEVRKKNAEYVLPTTDERITLITCWPYTSNTHRLIVIARPVSAQGAPGDNPASATP